MTFHAGLRTLALQSCLVASAGLGFTTLAYSETTLTVALAANPQMQTAAKLIGNFEQKYPDIKVRFQTLPENQLRPAVLKDVATKSGQYDVVMIGAYEVPLWAQKGWIVDLDSYAKADTAWNQGDLLKPIRNLVSYKDHLYATPFYGSSSFMFYRKDLFAKAGLTMPANPTWDQIAQFAAKLDNKSASVSGICLRGVPGWGQNLASLTTVINTYGGRWFDEKWQPALSSPESKAAITFYVNLLREHGQPDAAKDGWQECLQLFSQGHAAMWYDDTVFAGPVLDQAAPGLRENIGFAMAPVKATKASGWLWAWGLSIPSTSRNRDAAWKLIAWLTSPEYIKLAGQKAGWGQVPPGSRTSTYQIPEYKKAVQAFGDLTLASINAADPLHPTVKPVPYTGVQYVDIPEFEQIGDFSSQQIAGAISGQMSVDQAIAASEKKTKDIMEDAGYLK
ncbi:ABC transporter substrate-binding protein [Caballeronia ptereochthonis]|uniref:Periplasmic ABC transporter substrate-binding component n=1 Tax=Caballeronia ptereochthonis TaxID=1777144 RepID=A0A158AIB2_9BURK|nr:sugar ABC transporter substrate-binding protein [Caballeronia ptereochthonis]SAK57544.1 periplasmic ABC transporter substrate-binding component [Caballeronia ptereochthonis]